MTTTITKFAKTNFRNQDRAFGIKTDDRRRHMYIIGKTGMGKTNLLENLAIQDIQNGHGVAFIDPHGDTAEKLIRMIPPERIKDVIYFNPADLDFPIAFNVMEQVGPEYRHLVASGLVGVFKKLWAESWGPRLEYILRNAILALLEYPGSTLLGVMRILVDKRYKSMVVEKITDPVVKSFWVDEFTKWNERVLQEVVAPIQNKVGQFLSTALIRNIVGQTRSAFSVRDAMDSQKIIILNLSKGRIGEDNSALLGAMMITKIQMAAMGRVDMEEDARKDFYLYVDEFQNFATESFANILSEARKYRLNLILANQYVNQLIEVVRDAIFGNTGTIISFRIGATDAEFLEKEFEPVFTVNDIVNLPKYNIYLKLMIDGISGDAFSATVLPPIQVDTQDSTESVIRSSREMYTEPRAVVEEKINRWSETLGVEPGSVDTKRQASRSEKPKPAVDPNRQMFDATCATCNTDIQVPFKPVKDRPTYCRDCLRDKQRESAKNEKRGRIQDDPGRDVYRPPFKDAPKNTVSQDELPELPVEESSVFHYASEAKEDSSKNIDNDRWHSSQPNQSNREKKHFRKPRIEKTVSPIIKTTSAPMKMKQFQYMQPKKFRRETPSSTLNLKDLRQYLNQIKSEDTKKDGSGGGEKSNQTSDNETNI